MQTQECLNHFLISIQSCNFTPVLTSEENSNIKRRKSIRSRVHEIVYEADTTAGKAFDILVLIAIVLSVIVVMLESITDLQQKYGTVFYVIEWTLTILFTIEYFIRIWVIQKPSKYIFSFYGLIDFFYTPYLFKFVCCRFTTITCNPFIAASAYFPYFQIVTLCC